MQRRGHIECLQYLHTRGTPLDSSVCSAAALRGHLHCLQYAHNQGAGIDSAVAVSAAAGNHLTCLQYALQHGAVLPEQAATRACLHGSLQCLRYLIQHQCPLSVKACTAAARYNHVECLHAAHSAGAPLGEVVINQAALNGSLLCFIAARELGCPWDEFTLACAFWGQNRECILFALENGCRSILHVTFCLMCLWYIAIYFVLFMVSMIVHRWFGGALDDRMHSMWGAFSTVNTVLVGVTFSALFATYKPLLALRWHRVNWDCVYLCYCFYLAGYVVFGLIQALFYVLVAILCMCIWLKLLTVAFGFFS